MPETPDRLMDKGDALAAAGRYEEAAAAYKSALQLRPGMADAWFNLGYYQRRAGRNEEALIAFEQALACGLSSPEEAWLNQAAIYADNLRDDAAAERALNKALKLKPDYLPALLNLGAIAEDRGNRAEAGRHYDRALSIDPYAYEALARLGNIAEIESADDPVVLKLRAALADPRANASEKASLGFSLGRALDAAGAYDEAFDAYSLANRAGGAAARPYDRKRHEAFIDALIDVFSAEFFAEPAEAVDPEPIFICGMFRSGSTLAEQILARHPRVTPGGELNFLPRLANAELAPFPGKVRTLPAGAFAELAQNYRARLATLFPEAECITDKRPDNFLLIGLIKRLFPNARIIHTVRAPMDNCLSVFFAYFEPEISYSFDLEDIAHYYGQYRRLMDHWRTLFGDDMLDLDYDAFVCAPRPAAERLLDFCGLEWDENCLAFHEARNAVKTASAWQVREPLYQRSSGRWRNYKAHLGALRRALDRFSPAE